MINSSRNKTEAGTIPSPMSPKYNDEQRIGSLGMFNVRMKSWGLCGEHHYYVCVWSEVGSEVWHVIMLVDSA